MATFREVLRRFRAIDPDATWKEFARAAAKPTKVAAPWLPGSARAACSPFPGQAPDASQPAGSPRRCPRDRVHADNVTAYAVSREHLIMPLTCHIGRKERERALTFSKRASCAPWFRPRYSMKGWTFPTPSRNHRGGSKGAREHVQRVGRVLRPRPGKRALVYELVVRATGEVEQARRRRNALAA